MLQIRHREKFESNHNKSLNQAKRKVWIRSREKFEQGPRKKELINFIYFTTITKQVIQIILIMLVGTDDCVRMIFVWEETGVPGGKPPRERFESGQKKCLNQV